MVCPAETPEGHAVGLVKNLALMAYISKASPDVPILGACVRVFMCVRLSKCVCVC